MVKDNGLKTLLTLLTKQTLQSQQQVRMLASTVMDVFIMKSEAAVVQALLKEAKCFAAEVEDYRRRKDAGEEVKALGPPHPSAFMTLLETLVTADTGAANKEALKASLDRYGDCEDPAELINLEAQVCRAVAMPYDAANTRIMLAMRDFPARRQVVSAMAQLGAEHKKGQAPPGYMEDQLQEWLDALAA